MHKHSIPVSSSENGIKVALLGSEHSELGGGAAAVCEPLVRKSAKNQNKIAPTGRG